MQCSINIGTRFKLDGQLFTIAGHEKFHKRFKCIDQMDAENIISEETFNKYFEERKLEIIPTEQSDARALGTKRKFEEHSTEAVTDANRKLAYLYACLNDRDNLIRGDINIMRAVNAYGRSIDEKGTIPSVKTIKNWFYRWKHNGTNLEALIARHKNKGNRSLHFTNEVLELIYHEIDEFFLTLKRPTVLQLYKRIIFAMDGDEFYYGHLRPSYTTITRMVNEIPEYTKVLRRHGYSAAKRRFPTGLQVMKSPFVMAQVEVDHTPLDIEAVDKITGEPIGRVWLTVVIEGVTHVILGFYISKQAPSARSVLLAVEHAIREKSYVKEEYPDIANEWPCWGLFNSMTVDNGSDLHAKSVRNAMRHLGIDVHFTPPGQPQLKGRIERFNRTANALMHQMPGTTFSDYFAKGEYKAKKHACLSIEDIIEIFHIWVIDIYHQQKHSALNDSPMNKWKEETFKCFSRRLPPSSESIRKMFWSEESRVINKYGIEYASLRYQSPELMNIAKRDGWKNLNVKIYVDQDNLCEIYVEDPKDKSVITVPCTYSLYVADGISLAEHKEVQKELKRIGCGVNALTEAAYRAAKAKIDAVADKAKKATKKALRKAQAAKSQTDSAAVAGMSPSDRRKSKPMTNVQMNTEININDYEEVLTDD